jgi:hypothetical protein
MCFVNEILCAAFLTFPIFPALEQKTAVFLRTQRRESNDLFVELEGQLQAKFNHARSAQVENTRAGQDAVSVVL